MHVIKSSHPRRLCRALERKIGYMYRDTFNFTIKQDASTHRRMLKIIRSKKIKDSNWFLATTASIQKAYLTQHCIRHHHIIHDKTVAKKIVNDIKEGKDIVELSHKYKFNPLGLLKVYIETKRLTKAAFNEPPLVEPYMHALKVDIFRPDPMILKNSQRYEVHVQQWLDKYEIEYYTQEQLTAQNSLLTPDFLLKRPILINDHKIYWIDAKNFYGAMVPYIMASLKKQGTKYVKAFGGGAFVFSLGYTNELMLPPHVIPDVLMLDDVATWTVE